MCARSLAAGEIVAVGPNPPPTACDALQTLATYPINFEVLSERAAPGVAVSEAEVRAAQRFAFSRLKLVLEPGGAAALAAALAGKVALDGAHGDHADRRQCRSGGLRRGSSRAIRLQLTT